MSEFLKGFEDIIPKRTKGKYKTDLVTRDLYKFYINGLDKITSIKGGETLGSYNIKEKKYSDILKEINDTIIRIIILENFEFKLPFQLGSLSLKQKTTKLKVDKEGNLDTKNLAVNYKETKELWKNDLEAREKRSLIFHMNEHTNGNKVQWWWSKKGAKTQGIKAYFFMPARQVKRKPAQFLNDSDYKLGFYSVPIIKNRFKK